MSSHAEEIKEWFYFPDSGPHEGETTGRDIPLSVKLAWSTNLYADFVKLAIADTKCFKPATHI